MAETKPLLSDHTYNVLKQAVQITLPAAATLYFALAQVWNWPKTDEIMATITGITTFLGVVLGLSSKQYSKIEDTNFDGEIVGVESGDLAVILNPESANLQEKDVVRFRIST